VPSLQLGIDCLQSNLTNASNFGLRSTQGSLIAVCITSGSNGNIRFLSEVVEFAPLTGRNMFSYLAPNVYFLLGAESRSIKAGLVLM